MIAPGRDRPLVSIVVPMYNERGYIEECLAGFAKQSYPLESLEVIVLDGGSVDGSREYVEKLSESHTWLRIVDNAKTKASAAFNRGVEEARGEVVCLFSAHGVPAPMYVERSVDALRDRGAAGVGGRYEAIGTDARSRAIGLAMASPFGMASPHRFAGEVQEVDTISHPAYLREVLIAVGPFDENLQRNSDYEMNWRIRERNHRLVFDPSIASVYRPRRTLRALARQFWDYGWWKARVASRHPGSVRARHLVPAVFATAVVLAPVLTMTKSGRRMLEFGGFAYLGGLSISTLWVRPCRREADVGTFVLAFPAMHLSWGLAFVVSTIKDRNRS